MFAALYRLLASGNPPSIAELSALGFESDPRLANSAPFPHEGSKQADKDRSEKNTEQSRQVDHPDHPDHPKRPDWSFPLVIVERRQAQDTTSPEQYLQGIEPFEESDDAPLGDRPAITPLLSRTALSRAMVQAFTQPQFSGRVDARRLSERAAAHRPLMPIPRKQRDEPVQQFWLLMDTLPELAADIDELQKHFETLPTQQRPSRQIRLTSDASTWFDAMDDDHPFSQLPALPEGVALLVVGNPLNPSRQLRSVLRRLSAHSLLITWLSPEPHRRTLYWGDNRVTADNNTVVDLMKTLLWPFPSVHRSMVRECRLALGGSTAAEQAFWSSVTEHTGDLLSDQCTVRQDRERYKQRLLALLEDKPDYVQHLFEALKPHIDSMTATFRHRAMLNLPDRLADVKQKEAAVDFFGSLAHRVKQTSGRTDTDLPVANRHLCAVIAQMADGHINETPNRLRAFIQIGQQGYSQFDRDNAIHIANPADAISKSASRGWVAMRTNGLALTNELTAGLVAALDVSEEGMPVEANGQRKLIQYGDPLPLSSFTLHSPSERIDIIQPDSQRFHFAESLWQDEDGVHMLTQERLRIDYPVNGQGPQFDTTHAPAWLQTCQLGIDQYGLWSESDIAGILVKMRWIAPGRFQMGSPESEVDRADNETKHRVTLSDGYWLAETACTQELWEAVMGNNPSGFKGENKPVERVSWDDVHDFLRAASNGKGGELTLSLPTEAQWEYACRAGTDTPFNVGKSITPAQVNYDGNYPYGDAEEGEYREQTVESKSFAPNAWGLYQMHGNVWEWCGDRFGEYSGDEETDPTGADSGDSRVLRGGSWIGYAQFCRSAFRFRDVPSGRNRDIGFRFAQVTPAPAGAEHPTASNAGQAKAPRSGNSRGLAGQLRKFLSRNKKENNDD